LEGKGKEHFSSYDNMPKINNKKMLKENSNEKGKSEQNPSKKNRRKKKSTQKEASLALSNYNPLEIKYYIF
jgi:hypothetical protein